MATFSLKLIPSLNKNDMSCKRKNVIMHSPTEILHILFLMEYSTVSSIDWRVRDYSGSKPVAQNFSTDYWNLIYKIKYSCRQLN